MNRIPRHALHSARANIAFGPGDAGQVAFVNEVHASEQVSTQSSASASMSSVISSSTSATLAASITSSSPPTPSSSSSGPVPSSFTSTISSVVSPLPVSSSTSHSSGSPASSPLSSSHFSSSSAATSSASATATNQPISVAVIVSTSSAGPQPSAPRSSTTAFTHTPIFYVGILLGTVIVIACVATVIAWWFRTRNRNIRRQSRDLHVRVPWARSSTVSSGFYNTSTTDLEKGDVEDAIALRRGESEKLKLHLELMGDRDVGMPKRTQSFMEEATSPVKRRRGATLSAPSPPPIHQNSSWLVSPGEPLPESVAYPLPVGKRRSLQAPPSPSYQPYPSSIGSSQSHRLSSTQLSTYSQRLHPDYRMQPQSLHQQQYPAEFGTPREAVVEPRFLGMMNNERQIPENGERRESWTDSIRNRMVSAFGYDTQDAPPNDQKYTNLPFPTPARARRASMRQAGWAPLDEGIPERQHTGERLQNPFEDGSSSTGLCINTIQSCEPSPGPSTAASHVFIPSSASHPYFQHNSQSVTSFDSSSMGFTPTPYSYGSSAPLVVRKKKASARSRPVSRASSRYSAVSRACSVMTVLTEKEEAAGRALRERWARGDMRGPGRV